MVISWPDFYADHDGTNGFSKFLIFAQNNPLYKFVTFLSNIAVYVHAYGPKFDLNWRFFYNVFFKIEIDCCPIKIPVGKTGNIVIISSLHTIEIKHWKRTLFTILLFLRSRPTEVAYLLSHLLPAMSHWVCQDVSLCRKLLDNIYFMTFEKL